MTEGLKSNLLSIQIPYNSAKSLRLALTRLTFLCKRGEVERREKSETRVKCEKVKNDKHQRILAVFGAGEGNRTPVFSLGS